MATGSHAVTRRLLRGDPDAVAATVIAPNTPTWKGLLDADRRLVLDWARRPRPPAPPSHSPATPVTPKQPAPPARQRTFLETRAEMLRGMRFRACRDVGAFTTIATLGAGFAIYAEPPITSGIVWAALAWLVALAVGVRYLSGRARGRGIIGTPENNVAYFAAPEDYAVGGLYSATLGGCFGILAMLAAMLTKGF